MASRGHPPFPPHPSCDSVRTSFTPVLHILSMQSNVRNVSKPHLEVTLALESMLVQTLLSSVTNGMKDEKVIGDRAPLCGGLQSVVPVTVAHSYNLWGIQSWESSSLAAEEAIPRQLYRCHSHSVSPKTNSNRGP